MQRQLLLALSLLAPVACDAFGPPRSHVAAFDRSAGIRFSGGEYAARPGTAGVYDSAVTLGAGKAATPVKKLLPLSFLSGAHIALGGLLAVSIGGSVPGIKAANPGVQRALLGAFGLPMGLLMVLGAGGELVTGNMAICTAAVAAGRATVNQLVRNLAVVYAGNLAGSLAVAYIANAAATGVGAGAVAVAAGKVAAPFKVAFARGVLCNWLVCMAVWMSTAHKDLASKAMAVFFPISGFVAMGLDHSVANMFLIPFGMMQGADISLKQMVLGNLLPVTLGNFVGGALFVGLFYHYVYGRN
jgi:formate/nitrite transporter